MEVWFLSHGLGNKKSEGENREERCERESKAEVRRTGKAVKRREGRKGDQFHREKGKDES